jgi:hypothetical protein
MNFFTKKNCIAFLVTVSFSMSMLFPQLVFAVSVTNFQVILSRLKENIGANHTIYAVLPSGLVDTDLLVLEYSGDFNPGSVDAHDVDLAIGDSGNCTTATFSPADLVDGAPSGGAWGFQVNDNFLTFDPAATATIADGMCIQILIGTNASFDDDPGVHQITNGSSDNDDIVTIYTQTGGAVLIDRGIAAVDIITDDQVVATATVQPTLTFAISQTEVYFGNLSSSAARYADDAGSGSSSEVEAHALAAGTNAASGYVITMNGTTLTDGAKSIDAIGSSNTSSSTGTEQFGVRFTASGGSGAVTAQYAAAGFAFDTAAFPDEVAASTVPSATTTYSARYIANIATNTEAGSYSATLTYIGTGRF